MLQASHSQSWAVQERLADLGLRPQIFHDAVKTGELYRSECTTNDPKSLPGFIAWARTTRALREKLIPFGWESHEEKNLPMVVHWEKKLAIVVSSGDEATGQNAFVAKTKYAKGRATEGVIIKNAIQLALFSAPDIIKPIRPEPSAFITWFLLVSRQEDNIFFELSLPNRVQDGKPIGSWVERILFNPIQLNLLSTHKKYQDQESAPIYVEVTRRE